MQSSAKTVQEYIDSLPEDRKEVIVKLREIFLKKLPKGFEEQLSYGMPGFVVPHSTYPRGYHADPKQPLPFISYASQKNHIALYHMGVYADKELLNWFTEEYPNHVKTKLDMGKSCIRFKNPKNIPFKLIGELAKKITVVEYMATYERYFPK
jgi:uncharacterized protein YdhG (YjbR/CyaY superfamily)